MHDPHGALQLESAEPLRGFALVRIELAVSGLLAAAVLDFEHSGRLAALLLFVFIPIAFGILLFARHHPGAALNPAVAAFDLASLTLILVLVPASYVAVQFCALVLALAYPLLRGELRGALFAAATVAVLVPAAFIADPPVETDRLVFYELAFGMAAISGALFTGRIGASESLARRRARELTRRIIEAGYEARRDVAQSLHDGPVQELVSADMKVTGAMNAAARGDHERAHMLLDDAREIIERNVNALRNELIALGPVAFDELSFQEAVEQCAPAWSRRYDVDVHTRLARIDMANETCGALFGIAQEAVANAGRHADASRVDLTLSGDNGSIVLRIADDGRGFGDVSPLGPREPGHLGLASMRERAEIVGGRLAIESSPEGTEVRVVLPSTAAS